MASIPQTFSVYVLARPNGKPFYVGKGKDRRVFDHETEARSQCRCQKCKTIRKIWRQGGEVQRVIVFTTDDEAEAFAYEVETIALYGRANLCNHTDGGEGTTGRVSSPQHRARLSAAQRAAWANPAVRGRRISAMKESFARPEVKAKLSQRPLQRRAGFSGWIRQDEMIRQALSDPEVRARVTAERNEMRARKSAALKAAWAKRKAKGDPH